MVLAACGAGIGLPSAARTSLASNVNVNGNTAYKSLYSFTGAPDGALPIGTTLISVNGTLYGSNSSGGANNFGTVFKITTAGKETVLYSFKGGSDGWGPRGGLIDVSGTLYGTTRYGGGTGCSSNGCGTVFSVSTSGGETMLHSFGTGSDGQHPYSGLVELNETLYGTTLEGGTAGLGTVYSVSLSGKEKVLHSFKGDKDGWLASAGLTDINGTLYSTTEYGGGGGGTACSQSGSELGCGTVFSISTSGKEHIVHSFTAGADGAYPVTGVTNVSGTLYGLSGGGGSGCSGGCGTVFSTSTAGAEQVLYNFKGGSDGESPYSALIDYKGMLYGTTLYGGGSACTSGNGCGTIIKVSTAGKEQVLYRFKGSPDGWYPQTTMVDVNGALYGTTIDGGSACGSGNGCGTVFKVTP
jgi:uncharacterized repeat protein (TIGR03803 family)